MYGNGINEQRRYQQTEKGESMHFVLFIDGIQGGTREQFYKCVELGVRSWYLDRAHMGFWEDEDRSAQRRAVDLNGNLINAWWVFWVGAWVLDEE